MVRDEEDAHFRSMDEEKANLWLEENLLSGTDANSIFYDDFPPLPDFPCMSSSSSNSSSAQAPPLPSSSSTATSCSNLAPMEMKVEPTASDVMDNYMDLIDINEIWDPSSVFQSQEELMVEDEQRKEGEEEEEEEDEVEGFNFLEGNSELAMIFLEWLKQNRDYISAEDMRSIKLKRSTIESASKRLGSTKEGKKQLLKLILEWVEQYQLHKKRLSETLPSPSPNPNPNPNFVFNTDPDSDPFPWMPPPPDLAPPPSPFPAPSVMSYQVAPPPNQVVVNGISYSAGPGIGIEHTQPWTTSPYPVTQFPSPPPPTPQQVYGGSFPYQQIFPDQNGSGNGERIMRLGSSATKEARKKRMARQQRRLYSHHHHHHHRHPANSNPNQNDQLMVNIDPDHLLGDVDAAAAADNWMCWSPAASDRPSSSHHQNHQRNANANSPSDRKQQQGWKTEKNLKFLLQKVLKQSDVGNLGRIVLPKKEAESHLPELESRDGISIAMEDIGTSRIWNMRYRFWPNNKSRMYLLENTGEFVRANGLQEGDFIVIYSDTKCGKYMIRGVKVRQTGMKMEGKKPAKRNIRGVSLAGNNSSLAPMKQAAVR